MAKATNAHHGDGNQRCRLVRPPDKSLRWAASSDIGKNIGSQSVGKYRSAAFTPSLKLFIGKNRDDEIGIIGNVFVITNGFRFAGMAIHYPRKSLASLRIKIRMVKMIFYAKSKAGIADFLNFFSANSAGVLWIRYGVVTADDCRALRVQGVNVTLFTQPETLPEIEQEACNVDTISDHHPGLPVWVETGPSGQ